MNKRKNRFNYVSMYKVHQENFAVGGSQMIEAYVPFQAKLKKRGFGLLAGKASCKKGMGGNVW